MTQAFLLGRVPLRFGDHQAEESISGDLSAAAFDADGGLWLASDELSGGAISLSRLTGKAEGGFGQHEPHALSAYIDLLQEAGAETEADIEGLDCTGHYLWFTGSHSSKRSKVKGKNPQKDLDRLATVTVQPNRFLLGRIPLLGGQLAKAATHPERPQEKLTAARLDDGDGGNVLISALRADRHLGPFLRAIHDDAGGTLPLASKENGFDVEGLAAFDDRLFVGLRGPVLRGWAMVLEIAPVDDAPGRLVLGPLQDGRSFRKHFVDLDGLGIRELARDGDDLLILAGPTMTLDGTLRLYRLRDPRGLPNDSIVERKGRLEALFDLPFGTGCDRAEGVAPLAWDGEAGLLTVYDTPCPQRCPRAGTVYADLFRLPK